jgi:hypothetical protein
MARRKDDLPCFLRVDSGQGNAAAQRSPTDDEGGAMPTDDVVPDEEREVELVVDDHQDPGAQNPPVDLAEREDEDREPATVVPEPDRPV